MLDFFKLESFYPPPTEQRTLEDDIQLAAQMRRYIDARNKTRTCACCSCRCEKGDPDGDYVPTSQMILKDIPNLDLLRADGVKTDELPRDALTKIGEYCLQPLGSPGVDENGETIVDICETCLRDLRNKKVPMSSLVRVDTGSIPEGLLPLSIVEEQLLGLGRACRYIFVMKPRGADSDMQQWCFRGHVIAFPNVSVEDVRDCFPMRFSDIPKQMQVGTSVCDYAELYIFMSDSSFLDSQVIFVTQVRADQNMEELFKKARPFSINGPNVAKWAKWLSQVCWLHVMLYDKASALYLY